jgi:hypothetical protein
MSIGKIVSAHIIIFSAEEHWQLLELPASRATARLVPSDDAAESAVLQTPQSGCEMVIDFIVAELLLEVRQFSLAVDHHRF